MVEKINKLPKCSENVTNFAYAFYLWQPHEMFKFEVI